MLELTITDEQKVNVTLAPTTDAGSPAKLDGAPAWEVTSGDATVTPAADGLSADLVSGAIAGDSVITVTADADLGQGVTTITEVITLHVIDPQASNLNAKAGVPTPK